jgi:type IV fimbrial biogenesis protein FimT
MTQFCQRRTGEKVLLFRGANNLMKKSTGFTLIELMVTLAIAAVLVAIAMPSYRSITNSSRIASEMNALIGSLQFARAEAIKQGLPVTVCASTDGATCSAATAWQTGWIVFLDINANTVVNTGAGGDVILRKQASFSTLDNFIADNGTGAIVFNRDGYITGLAANPVTLTLKPIGATDTSWTRCLAVGSIGRLTIQKSGTGSCT